jgi:hypothetical protein
MRHTGTRKAEASRSADIPIENLDSLESIPLLLLTSFFISITSAS